MRLSNYRILFFNDTPTTEIYTLSLHDALPISRVAHAITERFPDYANMQPEVLARDRKSTRLNSSHVEISYAVFCLKKKNRCTVYLICEQEILEYCTVFNY